MLSLDELVKFSTLVESGQNTKQNKKPDVLNYHRFYVPVRTGDEIATIRIVAEEYVGSNGLSPIDVTVYDVIIDKNDPLPTITATNGPDSIRQRIIS